MNKNIKHVQKHVKQGMEINCEISDHACLTVPTQNDSCCHAPLPRFVFLTFPLHDPCFIKPEITDIFGRFLRDLTLLFPLWMKHSSVLSLIPIICKQQRKMAFSKCLYF